MKNLFYFIFRYFIKTTFFFIFYNLSNTIMLFYFCKKIVNVSHSWSETAHSTRVNKSGIFLTSLTED